MALAYISLGLGFLGLFLPVLPTVPFVLLSAFAASRSSEALDAWLRQHRAFGPMIANWERNGSVSRRAKWLATLMMGISAIVLILFSPQPWIALLGCVVMMIVDVWLWRRPEM